MIYSSIVSNSSDKGALIYCSTFTNKYITENHKIIIYYPPIQVILNYFCTHLHT